MAKAGTFKKKKRKSEQVELEGRGVYKAAEGQNVKDQKVQVGQTERRRKSGEVRKRERGERRGEAGPVDSRVGECVCGYGMRRGMRRGMRNEEWSGDKMCVWP
jgi:hypothetical protein